MSARPHKTGLVLAGGAARGAYEAGVLAYLCLLYTSDAADE